MKQNYIFKFLLLLLTVFVTVSLQARENIGEPINNNQNLAQFAFNCNPATSQTVLSVNNANAFYSTSGNIYYDFNGGGAGYEIPAGQGIHSVFAGAIWLGALDESNNLKVAAQTYRQNGEDFWPGPLDEMTGETESAICSDYDRYWEISREDIDAHIADAADGTVQGPIPTAVNQWPGKDNPFSIVDLPAGQSMAPFVDADGDGVYNPADGDYPDIPGDGATWFVINDKGNNHMSSGGEAIGLEVQILAYAYNSVDNMQDITFTDYTLINRSGEQVKKAYLGSWLDPDLGDYLDDYVGCDTTRNLGICYNGDADDAVTAGGYGTDPPYVGLQILDGILVENGEKLGMTSFVYYNNDEGVTGNPNEASDFYGYLTGVWKDSTDITIGGTGYNPGSTDVAPFMFPNDPSDAAGWSECSAGNIVGDRRFILATGAFDISVGDVKTLTNAVIWTKPTDSFNGNCGTFTAIQTLADDVLQFYNDNIYVDDIPPAITIDGGDFVIIPEGTGNWDAPTATALDNEDGDVTVSVDASNVDLTTEGEYQVIYTAVDSNGNTSMAILTVFVDSSLTGIEDDLQSKIQIYPNPVESIAFIDLADNAADYIQIHDFAGRLVKDIAVNDNLVKIEVEKFEKGMYIYTVFNETKPISQNKFIVK